MLADYREASESTPVYLRDWKRAQSALSSRHDHRAGRKSVRGKSQAGGWLSAAARRKLRHARAEFEQARVSLPIRPIRISVLP